ncbi:ABC transporter substrate-binding protein [Aliivibrio salmonicida]|uniref:ABC transporter substrate-binding protein n=1 Tax=Aliivibrio salmonicida TaxID=40269 RepID=UPI003D0A0FFA
MMARIIIFVIFIIQSSLLLAAKPEVLKVYFDADRTGYIESALSIEQGVKVAFAEVNNQIAGIPVEFISTDHRGNVLRSRKNMERFYKDPNGLVYVAGLHSPPLIKYREYINESQILTLVPWAAGSPISRYPSEDKNYIFRLSVDDSKVGRILVNHALKNQCQQPQLMLENTAWGKSNEKAMLAALPTRLKNKVKVTWFNWGISDIDARILLRKVAEQGGDCLLLVANGREGRLIVESVSDVGINMPVYSHWGITGGNFPKLVTYEIREKANLQFIQSCFNFYSSKNDSFHFSVFRQAQVLFPDYFEDTNIAAPAGFIHSYDLAKIFIQAANSVELTTDTKVNRKRIKEAMESLEHPIHGLIKEYNSPFSPFNDNNLDAHEALGSEDLCMAIYDQKNAVKLLPK